MPIPPNTTNSNVIPKGLSQSTDYKFQCQIITGNGTLTDISDLVLHFNLYESIFSLCMTGTIIVSDSLDIITNLTLHGNEWVYISLDKPSLNRPIKKYFRIYKVSNRGAESQSIQKYIISFCSEELILSSQFYVRKTYKGLSIDSMVSDILLNLLKVPTSKINNIRSTSGSYDLMIPRMRPLEAIVWLASRGYNTNENTFFFYESADGFNFTSYENMISQTPYTTFSWRPNVVGDPSQDIQSLRYAKNDVDFDILRGNRYGQFASSLLTFDLVNRTKKVYTSSGVNTPAKSLLNSNLPANLTTNRLNMTLFDATDSVVKFVPITDSDSTTNKFVPQNWMLQNQLKLAQLQTLKTTVVIASDFQIRAGMTLNLIRPKMQPQNKSDSEYLDKFRTAKYLVSAVNHGIIGDISSTTLELLSDSFADKIPGPASNAGALQQVKQS